MKLHLDLENLLTGKAGGGVKITGNAVVEMPGQPEMAGRFNITGKIDGNTAGHPYRVTITLEPVAPKADPGAPVFGTAA